MTQFYVCLNCGNDFDIVAPVMIIICPLCTSEKITSINEISYSDSPKTD